jgi:hypothetical protein
MHGASLIVFGLRAVAKSGDEILNRLDGSPLYVVGMLLGLGYPRIHPVQYARAPRRPPNAQMTNHT